MLCDWWQCKPQNLELARSISVKSLSDEYWQHIWWGETKINMLRSDEVLDIWSVTGQGEHSDCTLLTVKHGGGSELVWGCPSAKGVGEMTFIGGSMNGSLYGQILNKKLPHGETWREMEVGVSWYEAAWLQKEMTFIDGTVNMSSYAHALNELMTPVLKDLGTGEIFQTVGDNKHGKYHTQVSKTETRMTDSRLHLNKMLSPPEWDKWTTHLPFWLPMAFK